ELPEGEPQGDREDRQDEGDGPLERGRVDAGVDVGGLHGMTPFRVLVEIATVTLSYNYRTFPHDSGPNGRICPGFLPVVRTYLQFRDTERRKIPSGALPQAPDQFRSVRCHYLRPEPGDHRLAFPYGVDEPRVVQLLHVMRHCRLGDREGAADTLIGAVALAGDGLEDGEAPRIRQGLGDPVELPGGELEGDFRRDIHSCITIELSRRRQPPNSRSGKSGPDVPFPRSSGAPPPPPRDTCHRPQSSSEIPWTVLPV